MTQQSTERVALVTGGASGIGRSAALQFGASGAKVIVADLNEAGAKQTAAEIKAAGGTSTAIAVDVGDEASVAAMVKAAVDEYGRLDAAFNNAGISDPQVAFTDLTLESWNRMIQINLTAQFLCIQAELRVMGTQEEVAGARGAICLTSSGAGRIAAPGQPHYTAAKHGLLGLVKSVATEYRGHGIRCNAILPGLTDTPMVQTQGIDLAELMMHLPGGRLGTPDEVAAAAVWLCSPESGWVNGQALGVDGGGVMI